MWCGHVLPHRFKVLCISKHKVIKTRHHVRIHGFKLTINMCAKVTFLTAFVLAIIDCKSGVWQQNSKPSNAWKVLAVNQPSYCPNRIALCLSPSHEFHRGVPAVWAHNLGVSIGGSNYMWMPDAHGSAYCGSVAVFENC